MTARRHVYQPGSTHTRVIVQFHSDDGFEATVNGSHPRIGQIVAVSTSKAFGSASGSFSITIKKPREMQSGKSWMHLWPDPEDTWVRISFVVDGQTIMTMWGVIDSISEDVARSDAGARAETYTITGRDFGKVFEELKLWMHPYSAGIPNSMAAHTRLTSPYLTGTPESFVRALTEMWLGNNGIAEKQWELPISLGAGTFYDVLNRSSTIQEMNGGNGYTEDMSLLIPDGGGSNLWDTLQEYCNGLMNEMWVDLAPDPESANSLLALKPALYLRERMFKTREDNRRWDGLRTRVLKLNDVQRRSVSKGGATNRFNFWILTGGFLGSRQRPYVLGDGSGELKPGGFPIVNRASIRKHGVRKWEQATSFLPWDAPAATASVPAAGTTYLTLAANWLKKLHDWYAIAPMQLSGSISTTRIFPEIRIGERLKEERQDGSIFYYVEGVDHSWSYPGAGTSMITVTRGEYEADNLLEKLYLDYDVPVRTTETCLDEASLATREVDLTLDDFIRQRANACRWALAQTDDANATVQSIAPEQEPGAIADENLSLVSEGATPPVAATQKDAEMIPLLDDTMSGQAQAIVEGTTQDPVPPAPENSVPTEAELAGNPLPVESLEQNRDIVTPPDDGLDVVLAEDNDPLSGL